MSSALKLAIRRLAKHPGFCVVSVLMLGLGVAVSTLTFAITDSVLLRPLPFPQPEQLLRMFATSPQDAFMPLAPGDAIEAREQLGDIGQFALFHPQSFNVAEPGETPEQKSGLSVTANFLEVLGVQPALGRGFLPTEDVSNNTNVTVITDSYWHEHFGADPHVLGKRLQIESGLYTIIGVLPPSFDRVLLWRGISFIHASSAWRGWRANHDSHWMDLVCRLKPGVAVPQARARLQAFAVELAREYPAQIGSNGLRFTPLGTSYVRTRAIYWLLVGLAVFVLLIACANLGAVQLARALARRGELAIRSALGAGRGNLIAVVAVESLVVAAAGSVLGVLAVYGGRTAIAHGLGDLPIGLDYRVVAFAVFLTGLAGLVFGLVPAWLASGVKTNAMLKASSQATTGDKSHRRAQGTLVVGQIALAMALVTTAFSFVMGVRSFIGRDRGWQPAGLVSGLIRVTFGRVVQEHKNPTLASELRTKLGAIPGVQAVSIAAGGPVYGGMSDGKIFVEDAAPVAPGQEPQALVLGVDGAFFGLLHIPLLQGQLLPAEYRRSEPPVVVVSASFARRFWPHRRALGRRIRFAPDQPWREVVGVVGDVSLAIGFDQASPRQQAYIPSEDSPGPWFNFILRTPLPATVLEHSIRRIVAQIDPVFLVTALGDLPRLLDDSASNRPLTVILTTFAGAGLLIALTGLYGMMTQIVNERRREIGVRLALGADRQRILSLMMASGARLLAIGAVVGIGLSAVVVSFMLRSMPELPIPGLLERLALALAFVVVGAAACYLPSRRASRVDPVEVLRAE